MAARIDTTHDTPAFWLGGVVVSANRSPVVTAGMKPATAHAAPRLI